MPKRTRIDVSHSKRDGVWKVKGGGDDRTFDRKSDAVRDATGAGRRLGNAQVVIHKMDGKIEEERTYNQSAVGNSTGAGKRGATPQGKRSPDALALLKTEHDRVKSMLRDIEKSSGVGDTRATMLATLRSDLDVHETIEEEILYPALKDHPKTKELALEAFEEHHVVDLVMADIETLPPSDDKWDAKFAVLKENLEHHIEEEEGQMFKQARQVFSKAQMDELGQRMRVRRQSLDSDPASLRGTGVNAPMT